jgi:hypothetical protein
MPKTVIVHFEDDFFTGREAIEFVRDGLHCEWQPPPHS